MPGLILDAGGAVVAPWEAWRGCVAVCVGSPSGAAGAVAEGQRGARAERQPGSAGQHLCLHDLVQTPQHIRALICKRFSYHLSFFAQILLLKPERLLMYLMLSMCMSVCRAGAAVHRRSTPQLPNYR